MTPTVSIITAAFNAGRFIGPFIRSILAQTWTDFELIIVDDASQDNTVDIVESFRDPRVRLIRHARNQGPGEARNTAIEVATGKYLAVADADDLNMPARLEKQVAFLETHPEVDVVGSNMYFFNEAGEIIGGLTNAGTTHDTFWRQLKWEMPLSHPTIMAKAAWLKKYKYRTEYPRAQDRELFYRAYRKSRFAHIPEFLYAYRDEGQINPRKAALSLKCNILMRCRHWREYGMPLASVLIYPLLATCRLLYFFVAAARGRSVYWAHMQKVFNNDQIQRDQLWIKEILTQR